MSPRWGSERNVLLFCYNYNAPAGAFDIFLYEDSRSGDIFIVIGNYYQNFNLFREDIIWSLIVYSLPPKHLIKAVG